MHPRPNRIQRVELTAHLWQLVCGLCVLLAVQAAVITIDHTKLKTDAWTDAFESCLSAQTSMIAALSSLSTGAHPGQKSALNDYYVSCSDLDRAIQRLERLRSSALPKTRLLAEFQTTARDFRATGNQLISQFTGSLDCSPMLVTGLRARCASDVCKWGDLIDRLDSLTQAQLQSLNNQSSAVSYVLIAGAIVLFVTCRLIATLLTTGIGAPLLALENDCIRLLNGLPALAHSSGANDLESLEKEFRRKFAAATETIRRERGILENASDGLLTLDESLNVKSANVTAKALCGGGEDLIGTSLRNLVPGDHANPFALFFANVKQSGAAGSFKARFCTDRGQHLYVSIAAQWSEETQLFVCVLRDITGREQEEESARKRDKLLSAMLERMPAGMLLVTRSGCITGANRTALNLLSVPEANVIGRPLFALLPIERDGATETEWLKKAADRQSTLLAVKTSSHAKHLEITVEKASFVDADGFLLLLMDISANQKLEFLRNQLMDGITQKIVNPLISINRLLNRLHADLCNTTDGENLQYVSAAEDESTRVLKLLYDFLEIAQSNIRQLSVNRREVSLHQLMQRASAALRVIAARKGIVLTSGDTGVSIYADPDRITQVLINLGFNALKFTGAGGYVKLESEVISDNTVELRVVDSGSGIPAGMEEQIFEPFKQSATSDALTKGGSGLGLFICKSIIEKHGGTIRACNHAEGAMFCVQLPIDDLKEQRLAEYRRLRGTQSQMAGEFADTAGLLSAEQSLSRDQKLVLALMASQSDSTVAFEYLDPKLSGTTVRTDYSHDEAILPVEQRIFRVLERIDQAGVTSTEIPVRVGLQSHVAPEMPFAVNEPGYITRIVASCFGTSAHAITQSRVLAQWSARQGVDGTKKFIQKAYGDRSEPADRARVPDLKEASPGRYVPASIAVAVAVSFGLVCVWHLSAERNNEQLAQRQMAMLLARRAIEERSSIVAPQEPFRLPAASSMPPANATRTAPVLSTQPAPAASVQNWSQYHFHKPEKLPPPLTAADQQDIKRRSQLGYKYWSDGNFTEAADVYVAALRAYPWDMNLRMTTVKVLMFCHNFRLAKDVCIEGLKMAATEEEFIQLLALGKTIPQ